LNALRPEKPCAAFFSYEWHQTLPSIKKILPDMSFLRGELPQDVVVRLNPKTRKNSVKL
jgi:hypothetical protein